MCVFVCVLEGMGLGMCVAGYKRHAGVWHRGILETYFITCLVSGLVWFSWSLFFLFLRFYSFLFLY